MNIIELESKEILERINLKKLSNKSVLVTGASGLIGIYMVSCLKEASKKYNIEIYSWFKSDLPGEFLDIFEDCKVIKGDITDPSNFDVLPTFDLIIHSAGYGQPNKFLEDKIRTIEINTSSTINLFKKLKRGGKFLFVSTSEIYSGLNSVRITEDKIGITDPFHPRSCYIEGKRCGESICHSYINDGYDVKIVRLSLAYGPGTKKNDQRVLNSLIEKGLTKENIILMDGGEAIRTYCYITDVIEMFFNILLEGQKNVYNVGGKSKISILELANLIGKNLNKAVAVPDKISKMEGSPKIVNVSIDTYLDEFKKQEFVSIEKGIQKTIEWQKKMYL